MDKAKNEYLLRLCEMASKEPDPEKLLGFIQEISRLLEEKNDGLAAQPIQSQD